MALPCALISSSTNNHKPEDYVKQILRVPDLPKPHNLNDAIQGYEWSFETKYYSTTIHLCTTATRTIGSQEFANSLEAFIHFFEPNEPESFELTKAWLPYLEHIEPTIQILVCNTSKHTDVINRKKTLEWCINHGFELVELNPEQDDEDDEDDEEDDFQETTGLARIVQALHAHTWSNLEMKENPTIQSPYVRQLMKEQHLLNQQEAISTSENQMNEVPCKSSTDSNETSEKSESENPETQPNLSGTVIKETQETTSTAGTDSAFDLENMDWSNLLGADIMSNKEGEDLNDEELGVEEFEQLFQRLKVMKDKAETLPPEERKKYAEKVAVSFWKAIGGDEDEIEGVDNESD